MEITTQIPELTSPINDYIAGAMGGCAGIIVGHPLDTVKVQMQTQEFGGRYTGLMDCVRTVQQQALSKGYFRGLSWPLVSYGYLNAVFFGSYGLLLKRFGQEESSSQKPQYMAVGISSAIATFPQLVFSCPVEVIKVTLQSQIPHSHDVPKNTSMTQYYRGSVEAARHILARSGLRGLYRGLVTQAMRDIPGNATYMLLYVLCQHHGQNWLPCAPSMVVNFLAGGLAGVFSWLSIMPFDVVKSKLQVDSQGLFYRGFWDCARKLLAAEGLGVFFLGVVPMALRAFPVNAVTLMVYSESLLYLNRLENIAP